MPLDTTILHDLLVGPGHITEVQFKAAALEAGATQPLTEVLLDKGLIADNQLGQIIAEHLGIPFVRLNQTSIPSDILHVIPEIVARKQRIIAFGKDKKGLKLASDLPLNKEEKEFIAKKSGDAVMVFFATTRDINEAMRLYQPGIEKSFADLIGEDVSVAHLAEQPDAPVTKIVDLVFGYAYTNRASDIHIEPREHDSLVRFRIDGILHDILVVPKKLHDQIITRIKVLAKLRTDEHLSAQDGKMQVSLHDESIDIRVSVVPTVAGEKAVLRLLAAHLRKLFLPDLGLDPEDLKKVEKGFNRPYGMTLATGPTGSGKTSTIYAIVTILNTREKNIASIEDPVEYDIEGANQIQVNPKTNLTFADGLRSILRQDPDIIFVGEIRDDETAGIAVNSALTGHLVVSTLHTNNAATALPRLIDMQVEPFLIASTVNVIIAQRLVRKICEKCRVSEVVSVARLGELLSEQLIEKYLGAKKQFHLYKGAGCAVCHQTGYSGRIGIFEVLEVSEKIRSLIVAKADAGALQRQAVLEGMTTLLEAGLKKVNLGITTVEEVLRVSEGEGKKSN